MLNLIKYGLYGKSENWRIRIERSWLDRNYLIVYLQRKRGLWMLGEKNKIVKLKLDDILDPNKNIQDILKNNKIDEKLEEVLGEKYLINPLNLKNEIIRMLDEIRNHRNQDTYIKKESNDMMLYRIKNSEFTLKNVIPLRKSSGEVEVFDFKVKYWGGKLIFEVYKGCIFKKSFKYTISIYDKISQLLTYTIPDNLIEDIYNNLSAEIQRKYQIDNPDELKKYIRKELLEFALSIREI